jgi:hypothetical protein
MVTASVGGCAINGVFVQLLLHRKQTGFFCNFFANIEGTV